MTAESSILTYRQAALAASRSRPSVWRAAALVTPILLLDAGLLASAFGLAYLVRFKAGIPLLVTPAHTLSFYSSLAFWAVPLWVALFAVYGLYRAEHLFSGFDEYTRLVNACTAGLIVVIVISFLDPGLFISRGWLLLTWLLAVLLTATGRFGLRQAVRWLRRRGHLLTPALIIGANEEAVALAEGLMGNPGTGIKVVGLVDNSIASSTGVVGLPVLGRLPDLPRLARELNVREAIVATTSLSRPELLELFGMLGQSSPVRLRLSSGLFEVLTTGVAVREFGGVALMTPQRLRITGIDAVLKTTLDYVGAAIILVLLAPVLALIALLVRYDSAGPVLHRRRVLGQGGRPFDAFKFRTMVANADALLAVDANLRKAFEDGQKLKDDPRVTRLGRFLRRTSLDELPQLVNVLRGEMSLVGPRMVAPDEANRYGKWQINLLTVKPGITGPWQVSGRNDIAYADRVRLSMAYIRNYSLWIDLQILVRTIAVVIQRRGAY